MFKDSIRFGLLASCAAGFLVPGSAFAQDGDVSAAEQDNEDTIVVTARKRAENLIDVPIAVTIATQEQLERDQINNLNDLQRAAPALEVSQTSGGETNGGARLRGIGTAAFNSSISPSVALIVDQAPIGNLAFPMLYDLAQLEVLRGPQGTLFGQGASAGALLITTREPEFDAVSINGRLDWSEKGTAGSEVGELIASGGFNLPVTNTLAIRVATQFKRETGLQRSVTANKDNIIEDFGIRGRIKFEPTDSFSLLLTGEYGKNTSDGQTFFALSSAPDSTVISAPGVVPSTTLGAPATAAYLDPLGCNLPEISARAEFYCETLPSFTTTSIAAFSAIAEFELSDAVSITSVSSYRKRSYKITRRDFTRLFVPAGVLTPVRPARSENTQEDSNGFSQELRLNYTGNGFDVVAGGFYTDFSFDRLPLGDVPLVLSRADGQRIGFSVCGRAPIAGPVCVVTNFTDEKTTNRTIAFFADATVDLTDNIEIFGGLRYDDFKNTTTTQVTSFANPFTPVATVGPVNSFVAKDKNISGRIGLSYRPNSDINLYGSYSKGYKPSAVGTNAAGIQFELEPEKADAFELGAKYSVGRLQLSANLFHTKINNFQGQISELVLTQLISRPINIPSITSKGFEFNAFGQIAPGLSINAGYQYNDVRYPDTYLSDDNVDIGGRRFQNSPEHKFTLSSEYSVPVASNAEIFINGNVIYKTDVLLAARAASEFTYPAHEIVNGGLGVRHPDGKWTASLWVRNLTKEREPTAYLATTYLGPLDGGVRAWPVAGLTARVVGLSVGFKY